MEKVNVVWHEGRQWTDITYASEMVGLSEAAIYKAMHEERLDHCRLVGVNAIAIDSLKALWPSRSQSFVYFIRNGSYVKIGISENPEQRLSALQGSSPIELELLCVVPGGRKLENKLHRQFKSLRGSGEWFKAEQELMEYIINLNGEQNAKQ